MKYNFTLKIMGKAVSSIVNKRLQSKETCKEIRKEYKKILIGAKDIGKDNTLLSSYALCAFFIAMNRKDGLSPDENIEILEKGMRESKLIKAFMGSGKDYLSEKRMEQRRIWSKKTHERKYENDWVVDVVEKDEDFEFGFDYKECGVCKLCRDEGCFELAKYMCSLDFMLVEIMGIKLKRKETLAQGNDRCDFRFYK